MYRKQSHPTSFIPAFIRTFVAKLTINLMEFIYNAILRSWKQSLPLLSIILNAFSINNKFRKLIEGQKGLIEKIRTEITSERPIIWIHAASLGEFAVARPIINALKEKGECTIVVTFFSPTGYEALKKHHPHIDHVFYLPLDTPKNVCAFLDILRPQKAIFIISEYWINYLSELKKRGIPTYLISSIIPDNSTFFKWYAQMYRKSLDTFTHFMVLNERSVQNLNRLGHTNVTLTGDPLFDNAITIASTPWNNAIIDRFSRRGDLFIAGSVSDKKDVELVCSLANTYRDVPFVIVPHEINEESLNAIKSNLKGNVRCYSECTPETDFTDTQILIIDFLGALAYLYRYGKWAYIGGGFTPYLHSLIEATVYGLPIAFGPMIHRKVTASELMHLGVGTIVHTPKEIQKWFKKLHKNTPEMKRVKEIALTYTESNSGATATVLNLLKQI